MAFKQARPSTLRSTEATVPEQKRGFVVSNPVDFLAPRRCLRVPIPEIFEASHLLSQAVDAHLQGDYPAAEVLIRAADIPEVWTWTDSLWGSVRKHPEQPTYLRRRYVENAPVSLPKSDRVPVRMPTALEKAELIGRYGYNCVFCTMPLIRKEVRVALNRAYPEAAHWSPTTTVCHAGLQCMWLQYDHLVPHSRGGDNSIENLVLTCAGCNYGRMSNTLEEVGLLDPRIHRIEKSNWDGLERFLVQPRQI